MKTFFHYSVHCLIAFVLLGSLIVTYYQSIDGDMVNKPVKFNVDPLNFKTDKSVYKKGEAVSILTSYCRLRNFESHTTWRLINSTQITFAEKVSQMTVGCTIDKYSVVGVIPPYAYSGVHHFEGVTAIKVNPLKTIYINFRSQDFTVE